MSFPPEEHKTLPDRETAEAAQLDIRGAGRRSFARKALVGSAVLYSLGNRTAWGANFDDPANQCLSANHWASYNPGGMFMIVSPNPNKLTPDGTMSKDLLAQDINNSGIAANSPAGYVCPKPGNQVMDQGGEIGTSWKSFMDP